MNEVRGVRTSGGLAVFLDGKFLEPAESLKVWNHSPTGFEAGYGGSGPAQLALAILLKFTNKKTAVKYHQDFKWEFIANPDFQGKDFTFEVSVREWLRQKERE